MSSGRSRARFLSGETRDRPRFANRSPVTPISGAACVELSTPRGGFDLAGGNADARRGQQRTARSRRRSAHLRSRKRSSARRVSAVSREKKRADAVRVRLRDVTRALGRSGRPGEGGAPLPLDVESKGRANTPAGCARSVGFAADLRRGSLCGVQRGCLRARMWRAVHASGATVVCGTRVGHGAGRETRVWTLVRECNQPAMIIRWSCGRSLGSWDDRLCSTQFQTVVLKLICC